MSKGNPMLTVRMDPDLRGRFIMQAYDEGTTASALIVQFIRWRLGDPDAQLPQRPQQQEDTPQP